MSIDISQRVQDYMVAHPLVTESEAMGALAVLDEVKQHTDVLERIAGADVQIRRASLEFSIAIYDAKDVIELQTVRDTLVSDIAELTRRLAFLDKTYTELARLKAERER